MSSVKLFIFASAVVATVFSACEIGWREYNGNCYRFSEETETWVNARLMCQWHKSDLVAIETAAEQTWFRQQALTFNHTDRDNGFWLGGLNFNNDGKWTWEPTNQLITYAPWGSPPLQPNNRNNSELCLASMKYFDYDWSDEFCNWDGQLQYTCEKKETVAPVVG